MKTLNLALFLSATALTSAAEVNTLMVENLATPLAVETPSPGFSWRISSDQPDVIQRSYRLCVATSPQLLAEGKPDMWDSGVVESPSQLWVKYEGKPLKPMQRLYWDVEVTTTDGRRHTSATTAEFGTGMWGESHWGGRWIGLESERPGDARRQLHTQLPARYLRKEFKLNNKPVKRATAYISGLGLYRLFAGGGEIGSSEVLKPVPSDYRKTVYYNAYDITPHCTDSVLPIGIMLGNGRYFPPRQNKPYKIPVFGNPTCRLNILIEYTDGSRQRLNTDESWRITDLGPIRSANEYDGEVYDARMEMAGWTTAGFDDSAWLKAERSAIPQGTLRPQATPNMTAEYYGTPISADTVADGSVILDFGQNMAGWISFVPTGQEGDTIRIRYAERLNPDGTLYTANLRDALSEDIYICSGKETEAWSPSFTYHGFRYVSVTGPADPAGFKASMVADPMEVAMDFECSSPVLTQVVRNALMGIKGNYKGMPIDCPQRNERQPWLGDRTAVARGESGFFNNERLYTKWVRDLCEAQREDGCIPDVAPAFWNYYTDNVTWPTALPAVCDMLLEQFHNPTPAREAYPHIAKWMDHIIKEYGRDGIITRDRYGDWCMPPESPELIHSNDPTRQTDGQLISTAYTAHCLDLLSKFARLQGLESDAQRWDSLHTATTQAFNRQFLTCKPGTSPLPGHPLYPDSIFYGTNTPTANVLALAFNLVPDSLRKAVTDNLAREIIVNGNGHISTGVIGTSWLLETLSDNGRSDLAWLLTTNDTYPSWGYMARQGATTTWELWNGDTANPAMNSGNHVMLLGDLLSWVQSHLLGIRNGEKPGKFVFDADFSIPDCEYASGSRPTPYGSVHSSWKRDGRHIIWDISLPAGTTGEVRLPDGATRSIGSGSHTITTEIPLSHPLVVEESHLYTQASFPQCHAATITETRTGDLVAAYFGGTYERHPDVCIWVSRKEKGSDKWSAPILAGDGVFLPATPDALQAGVNDSTTMASVGPVTLHSSKLAPIDSLRRKACWNPVIFEMPSGELWLFYKVGLNVKDWTGWLVKSTDGGLTWGPREALPQGFIGPVKNKPEIVEGRLICASSTEDKGWRLHFETLDINTGKWSYNGPIEADSVYLSTDLLPDGTPAPGARLRPIHSIQPSILRHKDGSLQVLMRTRNSRLATSWSHDGGRTWSPVTLTDIPNNQSGTDAVTLSDGRHALIYNPLPTLPSERKGPRTPLAVALSDDGIHWTDIITLEDSPISQYSYPSIIQGSDGTLHCIYTWRRLRVGYKNIKLP
ncbi:MAG: family 78 glycoside hydrolase catalytic domain [Muribaculaceae bacterium]|nr:family 78 glycoside hydrolase catalytic domain [Muribaculaceae bacterium]